jgi:Zinc carboxypeptidase
MIAGMQSAWADSYRTYNEVQAALSNMAQANPSIVKYFSSIGTTIEGRAIPAIKITKDPLTDDPNKPDILFLGGHHGLAGAFEQKLTVSTYLVLP